MLSKPFRSPLLRKPEQHSGQGEGPEPHVKRRRISDDNRRAAEPSGARLVFKTPGISSLPRKPLLRVQNPAADIDTLVKVDSGVHGYYNVLWCVLYLD